MTKLKELGISFIRTSLVSPTVGFLLMVATRHGIEIKASWLVALVTIVYSGVWYVLLRMVEIAAKNEHIKKWAGIFLGYPSTPKYEKDK